MTFFTRDKLRRYEEGYRLYNLAIMQNNRLLLSALVRYFVNITPA